MAVTFNPNDFATAEPKAMPVILLLDVSGSMSYDGKIDRLNEAVRLMAESFVKAERQELFAKIAVVEFGDRAKLLHASAPYASPKDFLASYQPLAADGCTALGGALAEARQLIEDRDRTKRRWYRPAVVLVSDGEPVEQDGHDWRQELAAFLGGARSQKSQRFAIAIGKDANQKILQAFVGGDGELYYAEDAADIIQQFRRVTMSVTTSFSRISQAASEAGTKGSDLHVDTVSFSEDGAAGYAERRAARKARRGFSLDDD